MPPTVLPTTSQPPRTNRPAARLLASLTLVVAIVVGACASPTEEDSLSATYGLPDLAQSLEANPWVLDAAGSTPPIDTDAAVTLSFDGERLSGRAPCNTYGAEYAVDEDRIDIGPIASTRMACDEATSAAERAYFEALERIERGDDHSRAHLELLGDDVTLRFDRLERE